METVVRNVRRRVSFRLPGYLLDKLKYEAKNSNMSLNSMVERTLLDAMYYEPNEETLEAMRECQSGVELPVVDTSSYEAFVNSILNDDEDD